MFCIPHKSMLEKESGTPVAARDRKEDPPKHSQIWIWGELLPDICAREEGCARILKADWIGGWRASRWEKTGKEKLLLPKWEKVWI